MDEEEAKRLEAKRLQEEREAGKSEVEKAHFRVRAERAKVA